MYLPWLWRRTLTVSLRPRLLPVLAAPPAWSGGAAKWAILLWWPKWLL